MVNKRIFLSNNFLSLNFILKNSNSFVEFRKNIFSSLAKQQSFFEFAALIINTSAAKYRLFLPFNVPQKMIHWEEEKAFILQQKWQRQLQDEIWKAAGVD